MTQPIKYKDFGSFDNIVKETIRQFLPAEALTSSSATNKFFKKMMEDKETWVKVAKQLNIQPKSPATAKNEVITRLRANQRFLEIFQKSFGRDASDLKQLTPIELDNAIPERFKTYINQSRQFNPLGRPPFVNRYFEDIIRNITEKSGTKEGVDPVDIEIARIFIRQGNLLFEDQQDWRSAFASVGGVKNNTDRTSSYCPEHLVLFEELIETLKRNPNMDDEDKENIVKDSLRYVWIDRFPRETNYPYNFIEATLRSGLVRAERCFDNAQYYCPFDLWDKKEGSPITQLLKYATPTEKNRVLQQSQTWFLKWQNNLMEFLNNRNIYHPEGITDCLHHVIHWPVFTALIQGSEVNETQRQANIKWVNQQIDAAEMLDTDKKGAKEYFDTIRAKVKELIQK